MPSAGEEEPPILGAFTIATLFEQGRERSWHHTRASWEDLMVRVRNASRTATAALGLFVSVVAGWGCAEDMSSAAPTDTVTRTQALVGPSPTACDPADQDVYDECFEYDFVEQMTTWQEAVANGDTAWRSLDEEVDEDGFVVTVVEIDPHLFNGGFVPVAAGQGVYADMDHYKDVYSQLIGYDINIVESSQDAHLEVVVVGGSAQVADDGVDVDFTPGSTEDFIRNALSDAYGQITIGGVVYDDDSLAPSPGGGAQLNMFGGGTLNGFGGGVTTNSFGSNSSGCTNLSFADPDGTVTACLKTWNGAFLKRTALRDLEINGKRRFKRSNRRRLFKRRYRADIRLEHFLTETGITTAPTNPPPRPPFNGSRRNCRTKERNRRSYLTSRHFVRPRREGICGFGDVQGRQGGQDADLSQAGNTAGLCSLSDFPIQPGVTCRPRFRQLP